MKMLLRKLYSERFASQLYIVGNLISFSLLIIDMKLKQVRLCKVCLVLILCFSVLPEVAFSFTNTCNKVAIDSDSSEGANSCNEQSCPMVPGEPCQQCPVCCAFSPYYTNLSSSFVFHFSNTSQLSSITEDVFHKELFAKTLFRPPQSIL
jgi:hypothetical protein